MGEGELTTFARFPFGGLSTTPSSTNIMEKSMVDCAVLAK